MINYKNYDLMKECLFETFQVYEETLDVADYVPGKHVEKIHKWIYKSMKKKQRQIDKEDRKYKKSLKKLIKLGFVIDTTSQGYVLGNIDPSYVNFYRALGVMSGHSPTVTSPENVAEDNIIIAEANSSVESVAEENTVNNEAHAEGDANAEENK